jgi:hypothetical protein
VFCWSNTLSAANQSKRGISDRARDRKRHAVSSASLDDDGFRPERLYVAAHGPKPGNANLMGRRLAGLTPPPAGAPRIAVVTRRWPHPGDAAIAEELYAMRARGVPLDIWFVNKGMEPLVDGEALPLPHHLSSEFGRVMRCIGAASDRPGFRRAGSLLSTLFGQAPGLTVLRRFAQGCALAAETPGPVRFVLAYGLQDAAPVARFAAKLLGVGWGFIAQARDRARFTAAELSEFADDARFGVVDASGFATQLSEIAASPAGIRHLRPGVDIEAFPDVPPRSSRDGGDMGDPVRIVTVGVLEDRKGYSDLVLALADLPRAARWRWTHIGDGPMAGALRGLAAQTGIASRVLWSGLRSHTDTLLMLGQADIFVAPGRVAQGGDVDGLPVALIEAMALGVPVVACAVGDVAIAVDHGRTGIIAPSGQPRLLAEKLAELIRNPERRNALGRTGRMHAVANLGGEERWTMLADRLRAEIAAQG